MKKFFKKINGQGMVEYAILTVFVALAFLGIYRLASDAFSMLLQDIVEGVENVHQLEIFW